MIVGHVALDDAKLDDERDAARARLLEHGANDLDGASKAAFHVLTAFEDLGVVDSAEWSTHVVFSFCVSPTWGVLFLVFLIAHSLIECLDCFRPTVSAPKHDVFGVEHVDVGVEHLLR